MQKKKEVFGNREIDMQSLNILYTNMLSISVYRNILKSPATSRLMKLIKSILIQDNYEIASAWGEISGYLAHKETSLPEAMINEVWVDENIFTMTAHGINTDENLKKLVYRDLEILYNAASFPIKLENLPDINISPAQTPFDKPWNNCIDKLVEFHVNMGVGPFVNHNAFFWHLGDLQPVLNPDPVRLIDIKEYQHQRDIAVSNTRAFIDGQVANNILFYGDRGTGKSSTVKALLNEYLSSGLRMIEMPKESLRDLPKLTEYLAKISMRFIIFVDDLSFSSTDQYGGLDNFASLKAVLEGGLASRPSNVLIYATSNRRHLLRETFSDRIGDEIHHADTVQESVSLSDRFGIQLTYLIPDKEHFLSIVEQIAKDEGVDIERDKLRSIAEQMSREKGARSPRYARQLINDLKISLSRGEKNHISRQ